MTHGGPTLTSRGRFPVTLSFHPHDDGYAIEIVADGLDVRCPVHALGAGDDLPAFADELAGSRGWPGTRTWRSLEEQMTIDARWHAGGHVVLDVRLRPRVDGTWEVRVEITADSGSQMQTLAAELDEFFHAT